MLSYLSSICIAKYQHHKLYCIDNLHINQTLVLFTWYSNQLSSPKDVRRSVQTKWLP